MRGDLSIVVPVFNHERYVGDALRSALSQSGDIREVIVIDDGSTDRSAEVVRDIARSDPRVVFWTQPNQGAHRTINAGLLRATGAFLTILNSDDVYAPGRLQRLVELLELDAGSDIACSSLAFIDEASRPIANPWHAEALADFKRRGDLGLSLLNANFVMTTSNIVMRRRTVEEIGLFAPLRYAHDLDFLLRAAARGRRVAFADQPMLSYRVHPSNTIAEGALRVKREWAICCGHYLHLVRTAPSFVERGWPKVAEALALLERHTLLRAVQLCLLFFDRSPTDTLEHSPIHTDRAFNELLNAALV